MLFISTTESWQNTFPGAKVGVLELSMVDNSSSSHQLNAQKLVVEANLRETFGGFSRQEFNQLPVIAAYREYYRQFKKSYHVQLQLESVVLKGKSLPQVSPLVDVNFMAELETQVLTAGHDAAKLIGKLSISTTTGEDTLIQLNGLTKNLPPGDMLMADQQGIICTIIYGQDQRTPITPETNHVLYVAYAPRGIPDEAINSQFEKIFTYVRFFSAGAKIEQQHIFRAA